MSLKFTSETHFKKTEIGEIPKDWEVKILEKIITEIKKGIKPKKHQTQGKDLFPYLSAEYLRGETSETTYFPESSGIIVSEKEIIVLWDGSNAGEIFKGLQGILSSTMAKLTPNKDTNPLFLFYQLKIREDEFRDTTTGTGIPHVDKQNLLLKEIIYPSPPEQSRIAKVLSWFDDLIENKKRQNEILEKTAMAIFKSWFIDFEPFSAKGGSATGRKDSEFVDSELGRIPKGWEVRELRRVVNTQYGLTASSEDIGDTKLLRITDINKTFVIDWDNVPYCNIAEDKLLKYELKDKDIVISRIADIGKVAIIEDPPKSVFASYLIRLKPKLNKITPYYLYYWLKSPSYQEYIEGAAEGSTRQNTNAEVIKSGPILIPDEKVIREFEKIAENIRSKIILNQKQIMILRKIRDTLLPLLVFGKLRVEEVDDAKIN
ncbi:MAG: hypothetical protein DRP76_00575 [Candidatus Omnitrophota bacterium]|nr:MAG: hypothetical protein DRP76_00575 [Candidatus Omnitrophota bacterium]